MNVSILKKSVLAAALLVAGAGWGYSTSTQIGGYTWWYEVENGGAWVRNNSYNYGYRTAISPYPNGEVTVPSSMGGYPVKSIGYMAFYQCSNMTAVTMPTTVTDIGYRAFYDCVNLSAVTLPNGVQSIGEQAFYHCRSIASVEIPDSVASIGSKAFYWCEKMKTATLPKKLTYIPSEMFSYCTQLEAVVFPTNLIEVCASAFQGCSNLKILNLPNTARYFRDTAFYGCDIREFIFPENSYLYGNAFYGNKNLTRVVLPQKVGFIYSNAFNGCPCDDVSAPMKFTLYYYSSGAWREKKGSCRDLSCYASIKNLTLYEDGTTSIDAGAFAGFTSLTNIVLPSTVTSIGACAFSNCTSLAQITIPKNVMAIDATAFAGCTALKRVTFEGDAPDIVGSGLFFGTPKRLEVRVPRGSVGWGEGVTSEIPDTWSGRVVVFSDEKYDWDDETAVNDFKVTFVSTNIVVHYVFNSVQPEFAVPATSDMGFLNIVTEVKSGGVVSIPITWAMNYPTFTAKFGSDFTKALMKTTGKKDCAGNDMYVWQDYVAGTDPTNEEDVFMASITMDAAGNPVISYTPERDDARKALRKYTVYGKVDLSDEEWVEVASGDYASYHFFKVTVEMK